MIPEQNTGIATNSESKETLSNIEEAVQFYDTVRERLLHVNGWQSLAGAATASFQLTDSSGMDVNRTVQKGDHFKIDIPGPGPATGDGFDWVQVEEIEEVDKNEEQSIIITVRPATNPNNDRKDVAHFFSAEATSCFMVKREGTTVMAAVYGRNEKPNTNAEKTVDKARNAAVATGAISGFSKLQWKSLVNGLVKQK
jgi:hypothetical protein